MKDIKDYLEGHTGEKFWSPCYGWMIYEGPQASGLVFIASGKRHTLDSITGRHLKSGDSGECMIYPSPGVSWEEWERPVEDRAKEEWTRITLGLQKDYKSPAYTQILEGQKDLLERLFPGLSPAKMKIEYIGKISVTKYVNGVEDLSITHIPSKTFDTLEKAKEWIKYCDK